MISPHRRRPSWAPTVRLPPVGRRAAAGDQERTLGDQRPAGIAIGPAEDRRAAGRVPQRSLVQPGADRNLAVRADCAGLIAGGGLPPARMLPCIVTLLHICAKPFRSSTPPPAIVKAVPVEMALF